MATKGTQPITIFISSTYQDLKECRTEVEKQLVGMEQAVVGMEYFGATADTPLETCKAKLKSCKLMILLLGVSYGSIEPISNKSYTENEYDDAVECEIPVLAYEVDMASKNLGISPASIDLINHERLVAFKEKVRASRVVATFSSIDELGKKIALDVPAELERNNAIQSASNVTSSITKTNHAEVTDKELSDGATKFERFWLRPQSLAGQLVPLRLRLNKKLGGWKVKDELISALGLRVGDSINTEVTVLLGMGIIDDEGDMDLFADGTSADWLIDCVTKNKGVVGCIIDCYVRLVYCRAPIGGNGKIVNKASLVLVEGIRCAGVDVNYRMSVNDRLDNSLSRLLSGLQ